MYERFLDKEAEPDMQELAHFCESGENNFVAFCEWMINQQLLNSEIRFPYGKNYGWSVTFRKKKKLICDTFVEKGAFTVMVRLTNKQFSTVYDDVSSNTKEFIDNRYPCSDGGWIHLRILNEEHLQDIEKLIMTRC